MIFSGIKLGKNVDIDPSTSINNVIIGDNVKIAKRGSIFGGQDCPLEIGEGSYVGMNCILNGYAEKIVIGKNVSIAQNVNMMVDSGPNASKLMQKVFPITTGKITIGDHTWIGASAIIMPGVSLGRCCVVGAGSYVKESFPDYSIVGGCPARLIRTLTEEEKRLLNE